ncbi:TPA: hypothetical protein QDB19_004041 [Burkholderia vietnamiensis]|nr:hypothetical protein [Burkholderia vietnamiensis]
MAKKKSPCVGEATQRAYDPRAALPCVNHRLRVRLDRRDRRNNRINLFVLTLEVLFRSRIALIEPLFEFRETPLARAKPFLDASTRRRVICHSFPPK